MNGRVLFCLTTANAWSYTEQAISSIQKLDDKVDILVIDDASIDRTAENCRKMGVQVVEKEDACGLTHSWNLGYAKFRREKFDFLILANNDILVPRGSLEPLFNALDRHLMVGPTSTPNGVGHQQGQSILAFHRVPLDVTCPDNFQKVQDWLATTSPSALEELPYLNGFFMAFSREICKYELNKETLFDPRNINICNEDELAFRVKEPKVCCPGSFIFHFKGVSFVHHRIPHGPHLDRNLTWKQAAELRKKACYRSFARALVTAIPKLIRRAKSSFSKEVEQKKIVIVVGMHRSGTSVVSGMLHHSGISMGDKSTFRPPPLPENPLGFFENIRFREINDAVIERCGYKVKSWDPSIPFIEADDEMQRRMQKLILQYAARNDAWGFKDPRTCLLLDSWLRAIEATGFLSYVHIVFVRRESESIAASLMNRNQLDKPTAIALVEAYLKRVEDVLGTWKVKQHEISFDELYISPISGMDRLCRFLDIGKTDRACDIFNRHLVHHRRSPDAPE